MKRTPLRARKWRAEKGRLRAGRLVVQALRVCPMPCAALRAVCAGHLPRDTCWPALPPRAPRRHSHAFAPQGQKSRSGGGKDQYLERLKNIGVFDNVVVSEVMQERVFCAGVFALVLSPCTHPRAGVLEALQLFARGGHARRLQPHALQGRSRCARQKKHETRNTASRALPRHRPRMGAPRQHQGARGPLLLFRVFARADAGTTRAASS